MEDVNFYLCVFYMFKVYVCVCEGCSRGRNGNSISHTCYHVTTVIKTSLSLYPALFSRTCNGSLLEDLPQAFSCFPKVSILWSYRAFPVAFSRTLHLRPAGLSTPSAFGSNYCDDCLLPTSPAPSFSTFKLTAAYRSKQCSNGTFLN